MLIMGKEDINQAIRRQQDIADWSYVPPFLLGETCLKELEKDKTGWNQK